MPLSFATSELIALSLESVLYGTFRPPGASSPQPLISLLRFSYQACTVPSLRGASRCSTTSGGGAEGGTTASSLSRSLSSSLSLGFVFLLRRSYLPFIPLQHLVLDIVRLYLAFQGSETADAADLYFDRVTSALSVVKTSVYLAETVVSDLFIVRISASSYLASY